MNKTRKEIIELIEPYMDENNGLHALYNEINKSEFEYNSETYYIDDFDICYDITAVLKYIENKLKDITWQEFNQKEISFVGNFKENEDGFECYIIPNKPLHLYTEEEDKQLLELLTKIA